MHFYGNPSVPALTLTVAAGSEASKVAAQAFKAATLGYVRLGDRSWCGICGTDLHEYLEGPIFCPAPGHPHPLSHEESPVTLGHEFSGTVSEVGEGVTGLAEGDNVVVEPYFVDGTATCARRAATTCAGKWASSGCPAAGEG